MGPPRWILGGLLTPMGLLWSEAAGGALCRLSARGHRVCPCALETTLRKRAASRRRFQAETRKLWPSAGPGVRRENQAAGGTPSAQDLLPSCLPLGGEGAS